MYQLVVYVPDSHCEQVKQALFAAGAGRLGNYENCCWQCLGQGQFRPLDAAMPFLGQVGQLERVAEWRLEMLCPPEAVAGVIQALQRAHPYEEPAFHWLALASPGQ